MSIDERLDTARFAMARIIVILAVLPLRRLLRWIAR